MRALLVCVVLVLSACQSTSDSGFWSGTGIYQDDFGAVYSCPAIQFEAWRSNSYLEVNNIRSECGPRTSQWGPSRMDMEDGRVFRRNSRVQLGSVHGEGVDFDFEDVYPDSRIHISWERIGSELHYKETVSTPTQHYTITGVLRRSSR